MIQPQQRCTEQYYTRTPVHSSVNTLMNCSGEKGGKEEEGAARSHKNKYETPSALKEVQGRHSHLLNERR